VRKPDFDHVIAVAATLTGETEIVVIGSQAIFGATESPPEPMLRSLEADIFPRVRPERADEIDGTLGDGSQFQATFGYYAHGVGPETAKAPTGWDDRLVRVDVPRRPGETGTVAALCLEAHDLVLAKCAAGRQRDRDFALDALRADLVEMARLLAEVEAMPLDARHREHLRAMLEGLGARAGRGVG
jgi:hypothetical protein